jgi:hypothetical protein
MAGRGKPESSDQFISIGQPLFHPRKGGWLHGICKPADSGEIPLVQLAPIEVQIKSIPLVNFTITSQSNEKGGTACAVTP